MYEPKTADKVWAIEIQRQVESEGYALDKLELFLQIDDNDCSYYLVDHATKSIFWLSDCSITTDIGIRARILEVPPKQHPNSDVNFH